MKIKKLIKKGYIQELVKVVVKEPEVDIKIKKIREKNDKIVKVVEGIKKVEVKVLRNKELLQNLFSLYLHNQYTNFYKLSYTGKLQIMAIYIYI